MLSNVPIYLTIAFIGIALLTAILFYYSMRRSGIILGIVLLFLLGHGLAGGLGVYLHNDQLPPAATFMILPAIVVMVWAFASRRRRDWIVAHTDMRFYTYLHVVRLPVEFVLFGLAHGGYIPTAMSFEGWNWDILSGITAPMIAYAYFDRQKLSDKAFLWWNILCLGLLLHIVTRGILSAPTPLQQLAFDQPNIAMLYFPFVWLPSVVVPVVMFGHFAALLWWFRRRSGIV